MTDWRPGRQLKLQTENYRLRSLTAKDATDTYVGWWNDPEVQNSLGFEPRQWDTARAAQHIQRFDNRRRFHVGIFPREQELPIGFISIFLEAEQRALTNIVIGNKDYWGRRVVIEVRQTVFDWLFNDVGVFKIYGKVNARNFPSIFNYKAQGFKCEGVLRLHGRGFDGTRHDLLMFGILRDEWQAKRQEEKTQEEKTQEETGQ